ncbi:MAG: GIY-YIG nuclease family protein [Immundisolibacter sp.]|uniref:GIY-YIG nuclease family protein n=1 Tax=Immundisolibacter sp. TaxID=1934948 RepID=UPI003EE0F7A3
MAFWVYILRCADASYYTGHTDNLEQRLGQHTSGAIATCYTYTRRPLQLAFSQHFATREEALTAERQIKGWSRKKKEAMMRGDWAEVSRLARSAPVRPEPVEAPTSPVRPEPVEGPAPPISPEPIERSTPPVRPEPVEGPIENHLQGPVQGHAPPVHPSTSSGRTEGGEL